MKVVVLLPAYNEEGNIGAAVRSIANVLEAGGRPFSVLVVDDGSTDGTKQRLSELSRELPVSVLTHRANLGLGRAVLTGLRHLLLVCADEDIIVTMDADGTHDALILPTMIQRIQSGEDVIIASRYEPGAREQGVSALRRVMSRMAGLVSRLLFPIPGARDYSSGYRAYRMAAIRELWKGYGEHMVESRGFSVMVELLIKLGGLGVRVSEVPLSLRYDLKRGPSKMKLFRTVLAYARVYWSGLARWRSHARRMRARQL